LFMDTSFCNISARVLDAAEVRRYFGFLSLPMECEPKGSSSPSLILRQNDNRCGFFWRNDLLPQNLIHRLSFSELINELV
jgi:hypothetical protein